jgi:hypothetical protein
MTVEVVETVPGPGCWTTQQITQPMHRPGALAIRRGVRRVSRRAGGQAGRRAQRRVTLSVAKGA